MNRLSPTIKFAIVVGLQVAVILLIILFKLAILTGGTTVRLQIEPVDPRDPLRGDYVTFRYADLSTIQLYGNLPSGVREGSTVYIPLRRLGTYWGSTNRVLTSPPDAKDGEEIFLRGQVTTVADNTPNVETWGQPSDRNWEPTTVHVTYGIEDYFIPENSGRTLPWGRDADLSADVSVDDQGRAVLKGLYAKGKPWP